MTQVPTLRPGIRQISDPRRIEIRSFPFLRIETWGTRHTNHCIAVRRLFLSVSVHLGKISDLNHDGSESDADGGESETLNDPEAECGTEEVATEEES